MFPAADPLTADVGSSARLSLPYGTTIIRGEDPLQFVFKIVDGALTPPDGQVERSERNLYLVAEGALEKGARVVFRVSEVVAYSEERGLQRYTTDVWLLEEDGMRGLAGLPLNPQVRAAVRAPAASEYWQCHKPVLPPVPCDDGEVLRVENIPRFLLPKGKKATAIFSKPFALLPLDSK